jgi:hypothetical protein
MSRKIIGVTVGTPISTSKIEEDLKPEIKAVVHTMVERHVPFVRDEEHQVFIPDPEAIAEIVNGTDGVIMVVGTVETEYYGEYKVGGLLMFHASGEYGKQCTFIGNAIDEEEVKVNPFYCYYTFDPDSTHHTSIAFLMDEYDYMSHEDALESHSNQLNKLTKRASEVETALEETRAHASNALIGEKSGNSITFDDISPMPNAVTVSVESKNLVPTSYNHNKVTTIRGVTFTTNEDGSITMNGTHDGTGDVSFFLVSSTTNPFVLPKGTYIGSTGQSFATLSCKVLNGVYNGFGTPLTFTGETKFQYLYISMMRDKINGKTFNGETVYPMLMRGTVIEDYTQPVAAGTAVTMTCGEEEIPTAVGETVVLSDVAVGTALSVDGGAALHAEYNRDINHAFAELQQAIISLGGNV